MTVINFNTSTGYLYELIDTINQLIFELFVQ